MIQVENLIKQFNDSPVVNDVSFDVKEGENLIILGTSGCGKTTTLRMINRLIEPDSGQIYINGTDVKSQPPEELRRGIGYVLQNHGLFPHYTVLENIAIVPKLLKWKEQEIKKRSEELFGKLNLDSSLKDKYPSSLSGGQQQRVGVARSLMVNPPVLLMDEPFGALDNLIRLSIRKEFRALDELVKKTIIMVTHDVQEAFEMGDRICLMDKGTIQQIGTPEELLFKPANDFVAGFFKDQRLQLELKSVRIADVLPNSSSDKKFTVWDKMGELLSHNDADDQGEAINLEQLMTAFAAYKKVNYGAN
jgi:osmoprotectant transport system ATP-binding protein